MNWNRDELPYTTDPFSWFASVRHRPWPVILESRRCPGQRYDIIAADPAVIIQAKDGVTTVTREGRQYQSGADPFTVVQQEVFARRPWQACPVDSVFCGGAIGYFGYELARYLEKLPGPPLNDLDMPDMVVGVYDWFILVDHQTKSAIFLSSPHTSRSDHDHIRQQFVTCPGDRCPFQSFSAGPVSSNFAREEYNEAIKRIKSYIFAGDCYQVNLAQRFMATFEGDPVSLYAALRRRHTAPYSACLAFPGHQVLSYSPERFLRVQNGDVLTEPIKGTRPRGHTKAEDEQLARELLDSEKDKAENLMIVDLLRNDLGRCCEPGSIKVEGLFQLRSFPNVHHLVSPVHGRLRRQETAIDLLRACFPGGSITGAPKVRAMEIIAELEPARRYAYCGAIGYYDYNGNMDTNLAIRTVVCGNERICFWGGGGIVADSTPEAEYQESLDKVNMIANALTTMVNNVDRTTHAAPSNR